MHVGLCQRSQLELSREISLQPLAELAFFASGIVASVTEFYDPVLYQ